MVKPAAAPKAARGTASERREATRAAPEVAAVLADAAPARNATPPQTAHDAVAAAVPATIEDSASPRRAPVPQLAPAPAQAPPPAAAVAGPPLGAAPTLRAAPPAPARTMSGAAAAALGEATRARGDSAQALVAKASTEALPPTLAAWSRAATLDTDDPAWPLSASRRRLLVTLQSAVGARWQAQAGPPPPASNDTPELAWRNSRGQTATLRLEPAGARWVDADGRHWFAPLDVAALLALSREF